MELHWQAYVRVFFVNLPMERQALHEGGGMPGSDELVARGAPFGLGALRTQKVAESRRAAHELPGSR